MAAARCTPSAGRSVHSPKAKPSPSVYNGLALALLGRKAEALREVARAKLRPLAQDPGGGPYDRYIVAKTYAMVGEPDRALDMLED